MRSVLNVNEFRWKPGWQHMYLIINRITEVSGTIDVKSHSTGKRFTFQWSYDNKGYAKSGAAFFKSLDDSCPIKGVLIGTMEEIRGAVLEKEGVEWEN